ncbi:MAG: HAD-IA family hydrolase [Betaproteobacteria bacterium]|nr:HAD-IA family hydrolase [Betaproteobacteria bacterium]
MPKRFDLLVFDWDGTLMDSAAAIVEAVQAACRDLALPVPTDDNARFIIGMSLHDALAHILPELDPAQHPLVAERYRHHFLLRDSGTALFPGAAETIKELHAAGFLLAIATGKSRRGLDRALEATGLAGYFHATRCADEGFCKPHPGMLTELMSLLGVANDRTLMIGDTSHDMAMAQSAQVARLGVAYGAHVRHALLAYEPLACVDAIADLRAWLLTHA